MNESIKKNFVTVIIVSYNTRVLTCNALRSLYQSSVLPDQIIVIDNASIDGTVEAIEKDFPAVEVIKNKINRGFAAANNQGIEKAQGTFIWLLNSDAEVGNKSLEQLISYMRQNTDVGVSSPYLVYPNKKPQSVGGFFPSFFNILMWFFPLYILLPARICKKMRLLAIPPISLDKTAIELDYVTGAAFFARRSALASTGPLSERFFMYFEETDLCFRLKQEGWRICAVSADPVMHIGGGSFSHKRDIRRLLLFIKSMRIFIAMHYRLVKRWILFVEIAICFVPGILLKKVWFRS